MAEKRGVSELKDLLAFVLALLAASFDALADGKIGISDALRFLSALRKIGPALKGLTEIRAELADLTEAEKQELVAYIAGEFNIENNTVEQYIEQALALVVSLLDFLPLVAQARRVA